MVVLIPLWPVRSRVWWALWWQRVPRSWSRPAKRWRGTISNLKIFFLLRRPSYHGYNDRRGRGVRRRNVWYAIRRIPDALHLQQVVKALRFHQLRIWTKKLLCGMVIYSTWEWCNFSPIPPPFLLPLLRLPPQPRPIQTCFKKCFVPIPATDSKMPLFRREKKNHSGCFSAMFAPGVAVVLH